MKNKNLLILGSGTCLLFTLFFGCGERTGEKEYNKALASWKAGELSRAQGQMEKAIRKLSDKEKKAVANNQLGLILWKLGKQDQAVEKFSESCGLTEELTGANMNLGMALYHTGDLDQAEIQFTNILGEQSRNSLAQTFNGLICMSRKEWEKAAEQIAGGLKTNSGDPGAHNALALAQLHMDGSSEKAITRLKQITTAYPDYAPAAFNLAAIYDHWQKNNKAARSWYRQYLERAGDDAPRSAAAKQAIARLDGRPAPSESSSSSDLPDVAAAARYTAEGSKLHTDKKYNDAIVQYEKAIKANPKDKTAYYYMGLSYYSLKQYPEAIRAYVDALKIDPRDSNARYMLSLTYCQQKNWTVAEREARELEKIDAERGASMLKYIAAQR